MQPRVALEKHGFRFHHRLGQNFIFDETLLRRVVEAAEIEAENVLEVGAGAGSLTRCLCEAARKVISVEIDQNLLPVLRDVMAGRENFQLIQGDILKIDLEDLVRENFAGDYHVVANLPYYITTPVIMRFLEAETKPRSLSVMVQKEVAQRLAASPGGKDYGAITASVRYRARVEMSLRVPAGCFFPRPNVDSALVRLVTRETPPVDVASEATLFQVIRAAFAMRRKTLRNNLSVAFSLDKEQAADIIANAGLSPDIRGEKLDLAAFAALANAIDLSRGEFALLRDNR